MDISSVSRATEINLFFENWLHFQKQWELCLISTIIKFQKQYSSHFGKFQSCVTVILESSKIVLFFIIPDDNHKYKHIYFGESSEKRRRISGELPVNIG